MAAVTRSEPATSADSIRISPCPLPNNKQQVHWHTRQATPSPAPRGWQQPQAMDQAQPPCTHTACINQIRGFCTRPIDAPSTSQHSHDSSWASAMRRQQLHWLLPAHMPSDPHVTDWIRPARRDCACMRPIPSRATRCQHHSSLVPADTLVTCTSMHQRSQLSTSQPCYNSRGTYNYMPHRLETSRNPHTHACALHRQRWQHRQPAR
jgi:hypothetical protein